jgi:hypothetical protein
MSADYELIDFTGSSEEGMMEEARSKKRPDVFTSGRLKFSVDLVIRRR